MRYNTTVENIPKLRETHCLILYEREANIAFRALAVRKCVPIALSVCPPFALYRSGCNDNSLDHRRQGRRRPDQCRRETVGAGIRQLVGKLTTSKPSLFHLHPPPTDWRRRIGTKQPHVHCRHSGSHRTSCDKRQATAARV